MKAVKKLLGAAVAAGVVCLVAALVKTDKVQSWLYNGKNEDLTFAVEEKLRLLGDLVAWPVHFVKALLP